MEDEKMSILKMIEAGKITAVEGAELLKAIDEKPATDSASTNIKHKWLKIRVFDVKTNKLKVNVNIPFGLVKFGMRFIPKNLMNDKMNFDEIFEMVKNGCEGKIVDVYDEEDGEHVEITVE